MFKITVPDLKLLYYQETLDYVKYQKKNDIMVRCMKEEAQGIISKDASQIFLLEEIEEVQGKYPICQIEEVPESEYIEYVEKKGQETSDAVNAFAEGVNFITGGTTNE